MGNFEKLTISNFNDKYHNMHDFVNITRIYLVLHIEPYSVLSKHNYDDLPFYGKLL